MWRSSYSWVASRWDALQNETEEAALATTGNNPQQEQGKDEGGRAGVVQQRTKCGCGSEGDEEVCVCAGNKEWQTRLWMVR